MLFSFYPATKVFWACGMRSHQLLPLSVRLAFPCFQPPLVMNGNPAGGGGGRERGGGGGGSGRGPGQMYRFARGYRVYIMEPVTGS